MNARLPATQPQALQDFVLDAQQTLGHVAVQLPGATAIFRRLKLDFCCGGQVSLALSAQARGLDLAALLAELGGLQRSAAPVPPSDPSALIDYILERYHALHREQLPELIRMARRVEAVHRAHPQVPAGLAALLEAMEQDLLAHMRNPFVGQSIQMMRVEHIHHGAMLERLAELSHNAIPPVGACNTWRALFAGIAQLSDDLVNHIHLENNVLFAQFDAPAVAAAKAARHAPCCGACGG
jgi:regulator of cell morphogenesis and NO signaling